MTEVSILSLVKRYGNSLAVDDLTIRIAEGEFITLLGPSGCGKSTTLRCIAGFEDITDGKILFNGKDISTLPPEKRDIGMVFQSYALFQHMTVRQNISFGLEMRKVQAAEIRRRVDEALALVQLEPYADRYPNALSGGQQQRVALARAMVIQPNILLLDEPLANLDAKLRDEMRTFIRDLQKRIGITTIYVTHDQGEAMTMSDRVVVMFNGKVAQAAPPEDVYERPTSESVAKFVGNANILTAEIAGVGEGGAPLMRFASDNASFTVRSPTRGEPKIRLMIRPEKIRLAAPGPQSHLKGRVVSRYFNGGFTDYRITLEDGQDVAVHAPSSDSYPVGAEVGLLLDEDHLWPLGEGE